MLLVVCRCAFKENEPWACRQPLLALNTGCGLKAGGGKEPRKTKRERERGEQGGEEKTQFVLPAEQAWAMKPIWQSLMLKHASKPKGKALQDA